MNKVLQNFFNVLLSFVIILGVASCRDEDDDVVHNPFIGVWKENYSKIEYKKDGTWIEYINYYSTVHYANRYTETGTYSCDKYMITLSKTYDKSGRSYTYMIQTANNGRIVYYDPTDMYTWTLEYKGTGKDNQTNPASLRFDSNGGSGWMSSIDAWTGVVIGLPINEFTRNGYEFIGWNTKADGSGESFDYSTSMFTAMFTISKNITLYAQWESISGSNSDSNSALGNHNGYEYVDLGLSVKWATCNVGASSPEGYGSYFAWGETRPKSDYEWETYKFRTSGDSYDNVKFSKYNTDSYYGPTDTKTTLDLIDDAARANWGGSWRMPTSSEQDELIEKCAWTWTTLNGVKGYKVVSKSNGNSIFLPAAGLRNGTDVIAAGSYGDYWSSSLLSGLPIGAYYLGFSSGKVDWRCGDYRCYGRPVRAVCLDSYTISFNANGGEGEMSLFEICSDETLTLPICTFTREGYEFIGWNTKADGTGTSYSDGQEISVIDNITLYALWKSKSSFGTLNGHEWVDLGLSVKWATCNIGAESPEGYGGYFAWGETSPKSDYIWETYKYYSFGSYGGLTKYCTDSDYGYNGYTDTKTTLDLIDDAARVNLGGSWRMPTKAEQDELREKCTWTWTTLNGIKGYKVTSNSNGNSIFLPAAGFRYGTDVNDAGSDGGYWSSSLESDRPNGACCLYFESDDVRWSPDGRFVGRPVRAVCP